MPDNEEIIWVLEQFEAMGASKEELEKEKEEMIRSLTKFNKNLNLLDFQGLAAGR